jgi:hypothetical protein
LRFDLLKSFKQTVKSNKIFLTQDIYKKILL